MAQEDDLKRRLEELRRRRHELEEKRHKIEKTHGNEAKPRKRKRSSAPRPPVSSPAVGPPSEQEDPQPAEEEVREETIEEDREETKEEAEEAEEAKREPESSMPVSPIPSQIETPPARRKKTILPILGAVVIIVAIVVGVILVMGGGESESEGEMAKEELARISREAEEARIRGLVETRKLEARLESLTTVAGALTDKAEQSEELEKSLATLKDEETALRQRLEQERQDRERERAELQRRMEEERRERERLAQEQERAAEEARREAEERAAQDKPEETGEIAPAETHEEPLVEEIREEVRIAGLSELDEPPTPTKRIDPAEMARQRRLPAAHGKVLLRVLIGADGSVEDTQVIGSLNEPYDAIAVEAVGGWLFTPPKAGGQEVRAWIRIPVLFR